MMMAMPLIIYAFCGYAFALISYQIAAAHKQHHAIRVYLISAVIWPALLAYIITLYIQARKQ